MLPISDQFSIVKQTVALEAEGESTVGKLAVLWVILNRARAREQSLHQVCWSKWQFSCWNDMTHAINRLNKIDESIYEEIEKLIIGTQSDMVGYSDPTEGATLYLNIEVTKQQRGGTLPNWVEKAIPTVKIGQHNFYRE